MNLSELKLEIDALCSTWIDRLEPGWCKLSGDLRCEVEVDASVLKLLLLMMSADCLVLTKLDVAGAAVDAAGCRSTSKLESCALSSGISCTIVLLEAAHAPTCLYRLEAGDDKLPLFFWLVCLFPVFYFYCCASFLRLLLEAGI